MVGLGAVKCLVLLLQDVADFEWVMWFTSFRNIIVFALSGHVLFGKLCSMTVPQVSRDGMGTDLRAPRGGLRSVEGFLGVL